MVSKLVFATLFLSCAWSEAKEVVWIKLTPRLMYRDLSTICKTDGYTALYFGAESEKGIIKAAAFKVGGLDAFYPSLVLAKSELGAIKIQKDSANRSWVTQLPLNERLIRWVLMNSGGALDQCVPSHTLQSAKPTSFVFEFNSDSLPPVAASPVSNVGAFWGNRSDGGAYQATLFFVQNQLKEIR